MKRDPRIPRWRYIRRGNRWLCGKKGDPVFAVVRDLGRTENEGTAQQRWRPSWQGRAYFAGAAVARCVVGGFPGTDGQTFADPQLCREHLIRQMIVWLDTNGTPATATETR